MVRPTFQGLIVYLRSSTSKEKMRHLWKHYSPMIPFSNIWDSMNAEIGREKCESAFERTLERFACIIKVRFHIKPLDVRFEGFLKYQPMFPMGPEDEKYILERDTDVLEFLVSEQTSILKNSYIASLIAEDIKRFHETRARLERLPESESEKELGILEGTESSLHPVFEGGRMADFVPKYSSLEHYFTGMFVDNLLRKKTKVERPKEPAHDFEIEYLEA
jgi:hypothetical protein